MKLAKDDIVIDTRDTFKVVAPQDNYTLCISQRDGDYTTRLTSALKLVTLAEAPNPECTVYEMKTSADSDYFVMLRVGDRELSLFSFKKKGRADFTAAEINWLLNGGEKPHLGDWLERTK